LPNNKYYLFGRDGVKNLAEEMGLPLLAQIPVVESVCQSGDQGTPVVLDDEHPVGQSFLSLAQAVVTRTNLRNESLPKTHRVEVKK
jgi:ATP-binding protein involved in chromosome partitioning